MKRIQIIDSHTGGEPTRVVISGGPDLGGGTVAEQLKIFRERHDQFRSAVVNEPRGSDVLVGALLVEPSDKSCAAGVIFFNNVGCLAMCGHGTIGLVVTLAHLGKIKPGEHKIETPVGIVTATLHASGEVSVANVPSYRKAKNISVNVEGVGKIRLEPQRRLKTMFCIRPAPVLLEEYAEVELRADIGGIQPRGGGEMLERPVFQAEADQTEAEVILADGVARFDAHGFAVKHQRTGVVAGLFKRLAKRIVGHVIILGHVERV